MRKINIKDFSPKARKPKAEKPAKLQSRTLMLRINDQDTLKNLDKLQKDFNMSQSSKAIVQVVNQYNSMKEEYNKLKEFSDNMTRQYWNLRNALDRRTEAEKELEEILSEGKTHKKGFSEAFD